MICGKILNNIDHNILLRRH